MAALDLLARRFDQLVVLHAGWAGANTCQAAETQIEVPRHGVVERLSFQPFLHEVDAATWRIHLLAVENIGRAGGQTEAAVHAIVDQGRGGWVVMIERRP